MIFRQVSEHHCHHQRMCNTVSHRAELSVTSTVSLYVHDIEHFIFAEYFSSYLLYIHMCVMIFRQVSEHHCHHQRMCNTVSHRAELSVTSTVSLYVHDIEHFIFAKYFSSYLLYIHMCVMIFRQVSEHHCHHQRMCNTVSHRAELSVTSTVSLYVHDIEHFIFAEYFSSYLLYIHMCVCVCACIEKKSTKHSNDNSSLFHINANGFVQKVMSFLSTFVDANHYYNDNVFIKVDLKDIAFLTTLLLLI